MNTQALQRYLTFLSWLPGYDREAARGDAVAGLTVGVMIVPQAMAYALLAGVPPVYGLYAALVPLLVYPLLGTSRHLALGVVAIDMIILAGALGRVAAPGSGEYLELVLFLTLLTGAVQVAMGALRLGFVVKFLSGPVITGVTSGAAAVIAASQLGNLLGVSVSRSDHLHELLGEVAARLPQVAPGPAALGLAAAALLVALAVWRPLVPGPLVAVVLGTAAAWATDLPDRGVATVGTVAPGLPAPGLAWPGLAAAWEVLPTAITLALVQFMNVISLGRAYAARYRYAVRPNRELLALGAANLAGSFFRSLPVSASYSRTAVNAETGARTPLANAAAALTVAVVLLLLTPVFRYLPVPVLAAIIVVAALKMVRLREFAYLARVQRLEGAVAGVSLAVTLGAGVQEGVLAGMGASAAVVMYRISRPNVAVLGRLPGSPFFRDVRRHPEAETYPELLLLRVDASFGYANADFLRDLLLERSAREGHGLRAVVIEARSVNDLDTTAVQVLRSAVETLRGRGVDLFFAGVKWPVMQVFERSGLREELGRDHFFATLDHAVASLREGGEREGRSPESG